MVGDPNSIHTPVFLLLRIRFACVSGIGLGAQLRVVELFFYLKIKNYGWMLLPYNLQLYICHTNRSYEATWHPVVTSCTANIQLDLGFPPERVCRAGSVFARRY